MAFSVLRRVATFRPVGSFVRNRFIAVNEDLNLPAFGKTLEEEMKERNYVDPTLYYKVDIGLPREPFRKRKDVTSERLAQQKTLRADKNFEKLSRYGELEVPVEEVQKEWLKGKGPQHIKEIAEHYGVFQHLFGDAYFFPRVSLDVAYHQGDDIYAPVFYGNQLKPKEVIQEPVVLYESDPETFWTLVLTNPDGHLTKDESEYVHWMIGNIPGSDVSKGEVIFDYLQPFPMKGIGFQRMVFVLYKQENKLDYSKLKKENSGVNLEDRTFSTYNFYRERQNLITPAGLAFFQSDWDVSVTEFFHTKLGTKEPIYEYDFAPPYYSEQTYFPVKEPFNIYLDKYRDPKDINRDYLLQRLENENPFSRPKPKLRFPNAEPLPRSMPSWLQDKVKRDRLGWGRINEVEEYDGPPTDSLHSRFPWTN
ncbi:large ribosomal subunit protein mL38 [Neocloeon triangulifer]|uniref:large ribosomal subunit protein mL38 n=1 Tax=Neocloeon triangulifer TaxID=2078957 RepID=UPI00286F8F50|nr:large ribosomal subunit protein mL38 [Neocloeon triangulifer]